MSVRISDLLQITITIEPSRLEELLEELASLPHAIAVELFHGEWKTDVKFPAYRNWVDDVHAVLTKFEGARLRYLPVLDSLQAA